MPNAFDPSALPAQLGAAAMARITLLLNHVLAAEPVATQRLKPHAGRAIQLQWTGWPSLLPTPPRVAYMVTPAGLLEWCGDNEPPHFDLTVTLDASNPLRLAAMWLTGDRPKVGIVGDSGLAADVSWLIDNLRWDLEDDLARVIGQAPAHQLSTGARAIAGGLREAVRTLQNLMSRGGDGTGPR